jgi:hypothetical protein
MPSTGKGDKLCIGYPIIITPNTPIIKNIWIKIRFIHETDKAILVYCDNEKIWIPKSRVYKIMFQNLFLLLFFHRAFAGLFAFLLLAPGLRLNPLLHLGSGRAAAPTALSASRE